MIAERHYDRAGALAVALTVLLSFAALVPFLDRERLVSLLQDDAFYYFTIARHVAAGDGFTFDGLHRTNGFQPLWLFLLVPLFRLVPDDVLALRAVLVVQSGLVAAAAGPRDSRDYANGAR